MNEMHTGWIRRESVINALRDKMGEVSRRVVESGENQGYELGQVLGYTDALKFAITLISDLPDEPRPDGPRPILGRPETFG